MNYTIKLVLILLLVPLPITCFSKKAIIVGASSGMGREVAKRLSKEGYSLGLVARRVPLLESLQQEIKGPSYIKRIDVTAPNAREAAKGAY